MVERIVAAVCITGTNYCLSAIVFNYGCCQALVNNNVYTKKQLLQFVLQISQPCLLNVLTNGEPERVLSV